MRQFLLVSALLAASLTDAPPTRAVLERAPSCEVLISLGYQGRSRAMDHAFLKRFADMSVADLDEALGVVSGCIDRIAARQPDIPGLLPWEQKAVQVNVLSLLAEELRGWRSRQREHERALRAGR